MRERRDVVVGVDASNYTTSLCAVDAGDGELLHDGRRVLDVAPGERGLMQSAALFQHVRNFPALLVRLRAASMDAGWNILAIGVSDRPRDLPGSYMPVFQAGVLAAHALAAGTGAAVWSTTHQAGHVAAGIATSSLALAAGEPFVVLHLSGGTTDVLQGEAGTPGFGLRTVAEGLDLHVGQFVDRVGVRLGLPFPSGIHLERLAKEWDGPAPSIPSAVRGGCPSFSGPLSAALRLIDGGAPAAAVAAAVQRTIAATVEKVIRSAQEKTGITPVLLVGGVASNQAIRRRLAERFRQRGDGSGPLYFCTAGFASDNAFGIALIARQSICGNE